jgi:hypothetical protein
MLFVNIPVADIERSKAFFARLGFSYHPMFTDQTAACMLARRPGRRRGLVAGRWMRPVRSSRARPPPG